MSRFFLIIRGAVQDRLSNGRRDDDPLQILLDKGHSVLEITQVRHLSSLSFSTSLIFLFSLSSGIISSLSLHYLPELQTLGS